MSVKNTPERFWRRVSRGEPEHCWEWQGAVTSMGYGNVSWSGKFVLAHRLAYYIEYGGITLETGFRTPGVAKQYQQFVLHKCDNRRCCNPQHLFLGSMSDNMLDAYIKCRKKQPQSTHANAKLSPQDIHAIRDAYAAGEAVQATLAKKHGVSQTAISLVVRGETYRDST